MILTSILGMQASPKPRSEIQAGTGSVTVDAKRSAWTGTNELQIQGGTGDVTVYLPRGVGLRVEVESGIGNIDVRGLDRDGDEYENSLASTSDEKPRTHRR